MNVRLPHGRVVHLNRDGRTVCGLPVTVSADYLQKPATCKRCLHLAAKAR